MYTLVGTLSDLCTTQAELFRKGTRVRISLARRSSNQLRPSVRRSNSPLAFPAASVAAFALNLLSSFRRCWAKAANMRLPVALVALFASIAVTIDATIYFKEQFVDGGNVPAGWMFTRCHLVLAFKA